MGLAIFSQNLYIYIRRQIPGRSTEEQYGYFKTILALIFFFYICFALVVNFSPLKQYILSYIDMEWSILFFSMTILFFQLLNTESAHFNIAIQKIEIKNIGVFIRTIVYSGGIIISGLFLSKFELTYVLLLIIFAEVSEVFYYIRHFNFFTFFRSSWKKDVVTKGYRYALPLYPVGLSAMAIIYMDRYLLSIIENLEKVGQYGFAISIVIMVGGLIGTALTLAIFPYATEAQNKNDIQARNKLLIMNIRYGILLTLLFYVFLVVNRGWFVDLIGGKQYAPAKELFLILGVYPILQLINSVASHHLQLINKTKVQAIMYPIFFLIDLSLSYCLIKLYGLIGAAIANILSLVIMSFISIFVVTYYDMSMKNELKNKCIYSLGICCAILTLFSLSIDTFMPKNIPILFINNAMLLTACVLSIYFSGCLKSGEKQFILSLLGVKK